MPAALVVLAAGSGSRVGAGVNKVLLPLAGVPLLARTVLDALAVADVARVLVVVRPGEEAEIGAALVEHLGEAQVWLAPGGRTRHESEWAAVRALREDVEAGTVDVVAVHDGARPLAGPGLWQATIDAAREHGGAIPVLAATNLLGTDLTRPAGVLASVQTPQAFDAVRLLRAHEAAQRDGFEGTDTAACLTRYTDVAIAAVAGSPENLKVTFPEDVALAEALLEP